MRKKVGSEGEKKVGTLREAWGDKGTERETDGGTDERLLIKYKSFLSTFHLEILFFLICKTTCGNSATQVSSRKP